MSSFERLIKIAGAFVAVAVVGLCFLKVQRVTQSAHAYGALLGSAAMIVATVPATQTPTAAQVAAACDRIGDGKGFEFGSVSAGSTPPAGAFAAVVVHPAPVNGVLVGCYALDEEQGAEVLDSRAVRLTKPRRFSPADCGPADRVLWLVAR